MAIIRGAFGGGQIKGSIAGNTFQQGRYGTVVRNRTVPVNPNTGIQVAVRDAFSILSDRWVSVLTAAQRAAWEAYASLTPLPDKFGQPVATSGRQMYLRTNVNRVYQAGAALDTAPATPGVAGSITFDVVASVANDIEFDNPSPAIGAGQGVVIRIGRAVNLTRNFYKAPFSYFESLTNATVFPLFVPPPFALAIGQRLFFASRVYDADGKVSFESIQHTDVVA